MISVSGDGTSTHLQPLEQFASSDLSSIRYIFSDLDDTITSSGELLLPAYEALVNLARAGYELIIVTGGPAGWCDCITHMWPVRAVIGEAGAFYMTRDQHNKQLWIRHLLPESEFLNYSAELTLIKDNLVRKYPQIRFASDQFSRLYDLAVVLSSIQAQTLEEIKTDLISRGVNVKISSIHMNIGLGNWDKLSTSKLLSQELLNIDLSKINDQCAFIGDSPNDEVMFSFFHKTIGVSNLMDFSCQMKTYPRYLTRAARGLGFAEFADLLLNKKDNALGSA